VDHVEDFVNQNMNNDNSTDKTTNLMYIDVNSILEDNLVHVGYIYDQFKSDIARLKDLRKSKSFKGQWKVCFMSITYISESFCYWSQ